MSFGRKFLGLSLCPGLVFFISSSIFANSTASSPASTSTPVSPEVSAQLEDFNQIVFGDSTHPRTPDPQTNQRILDYFRFKIRTQKGRSLSQEDHEFFSNWIKTADPQTLRAASRVLFRIPMTKKRLDAIRLALLIPIDIWAAVTLLHWFTPNGLESRIIHPANHPDIYLFLQTSQALLATYFIVTSARFLYSSVMKKRMGDAELRKQRNEWMQRYYAAVLQPDSNARSKIFELPIKEVKSITFIRPSVLCIKKAALLSSNLKNLVKNFRASKAGPPI